MTLILLAVYIALGYWAFNKLWWSKNTYLYANTEKFYMSRIGIALVFGWIAIPIALLVTILGILFGK